MLESRHTDTGNHQTRIFEVHLAPRKTLKFLLLVVLGLISTNLVVRFTEYFKLDYPFNGTMAQLFNVDYEQNFPALYSVSALLFCAILLATIAYIKKKDGDRYVRYWTALSIIFLFLSLDEAISLHERTMEPLQSALKASGFLYYAWVIPGGIFVIICLLSFLPFIRHLPAKTRRLFLISGALFVSGALGMEMVSGYHHYLYGKENIVDAMLTTFEEFLEMLSIVVFIYTLLSYMSSYMKDVDLRVRITDDRKQRQRAQ
ncbi:MAG TPA: hypothetical protein V6C90_08060 [Coleofasciculaceae cyanobacterium]